jgi:hypothetical protein
VAPEAVIARRPQISVTATIAAKTGPVAMWATLSTIGSSAW